MLPDCQDWHLVCPQQKQLLQTFHWYSRFSRDFFRGAPSQLIDVLARPLRQRGEGSSSRDVMISQLRDSWKTKERPLSRLESLPPEILLMILRRLPTTDLVTAGMATHYIFEIAESVYWERKVRLFGQWSGKRIYCFGEDALDDDSVLPDFGATEIDEAIATLERRAGYRPSPGHAMDELFRTPDLPWMLSLCDDDPLYYALRNNGDTWFPRGVDLERFRSLDCPTNEPWIKNLCERDPADFALCDDCLACESYAGRGNAKDGGISNNAESGETNNGSLEHETNDDVISGEGLPENGVSEDDPSEDDPSEDDPSEDDLSEASLSEDGFIRDNDTDDYTELSISDDSSMNDYYANNGIPYSVWPRRNYRIDWTSKEYSTRMLHWILVFRARLLDSFPTNCKWVLRNLTTHEFVRAEAIALSPELIHGPTIEGIGFGHIVLSRICWSYHRQDLPKRVLQKGPWVGHRLEIVPGDDQMMDGSSGWTDISNQAAKEINRIWSYKYGVDWRMKVLSELSQAKARFPIGNPSDRLENMAQTVKAKVHAALDEGQNPLLCPLFPEDGPDRIHWQKENVPQLEEMGDVVHAYRKKYGMS